MSTYNPSSNLHLLQQARTDETKLPGFGSPCILMDVKWCESPKAQISKCDVEGFSMDTSQLYKSRMGICFLSVCLIFSLWKLLSEAFQALLVRTAVQTVHWIWGTNVEFEPNSTVWDVHASHITQYQDIYIKYYAYNGISKRAYMCLCTVYDWICTELSVLPCTWHLSLLARSLTCVSERFSSLGIPWGLDSSRTNPMRLR